ncbi:MAG: hypothetical protein M1830_008217 [Pleopsidium flavum]|nr:MAG: hypothetical protein M1830_008217 [Pleopsidium flavum]
MQPSDHLEYLLAVLREHEIPVTRDDVQWAFDAPNTKDTVVDWVKEHLGADTLLSKEELDLYRKLDRNGTIKAIQASHDTSTIRPILDDEIRSALDTLKASTLAIEKQNQTLRSQQKALLADREKVEDGEARRKRASEQRRRKLALEKQHVEMAADELLQGLTVQIAAAQQQLKSSNSTLQASVTETLKSDDRILSRLQDLAGDLNEEDVEVGDSIAERTKKLSAKLADFIAEEIRCRLDRIYLEGRLKDFVSTEGRLDDPEDTEQLLEEEMSSLYSEISAVAEMSVHQNFVEPIMKQLVERKDIGKAHSQAILQYVTSTLAYLIAKLNEITTRVQNHHSHTVALKALSDALDVETVESHLRRAPPLSKQQSPNRVALPYHPLTSPNRSTLPKEGECLSLTEDGSQSLQQLLRLFGISMSDQDGNESIDKRIAAATLESAETVRTQTANLESSTLKVLATYLGDASGTLQLLRAAMYEDSPYGGFNLADQQLQKRIEALNMDVDEIGTSMTRLDFGILHQRESKRENFIEQWS